MNDEELITAVREQRAAVHSATPVEQIIGRGRALRARRRRRIPVVAATLAAVAGTALAVTVLLPAGHPGSGQQTAMGSARSGSHPARARLAAWTVARQADGDIVITINQLQNPAGLQSTLRADGLPVNVTFSGPALSASCQPYATSIGVLVAVARFDPVDGSLVIRPSALPSGTGVAIFDEPGAGAPVLSMSPAHGRGIKVVTVPVPARTNGPLAVGLVYASQQCTG
jgi:hypothetical protein